MNVIDMNPQIVRVSKCFSTKVAGNRIPNTYAEYIDFLQNLRKYIHKNNDNDNDQTPYIAQVLFPKEVHLPSLLGDELPLELRLGIDNDNLRNYSLEKHEHIRCELSSFPHSISLYHTLGKHQLLPGRTRTVAANKFKSQYCQLYSYLSYYRQ